MSKFNLVRHFSLASLGAFVLVGLAVIGFEVRHGDFFRSVQEQEAESIKKIQGEYLNRAEQVAIRDLLTVHENGNVNLTRLFANALWEKDFSPMVAAAQRISFDVCRAMPTNDKPGLSAEQKKCYADTGRRILALPGYETLNRKVFDVMRSTTVFKIKVYDLRGITVYSSDPSQVGEDKLSNAGWRVAAQEGKAASELTHRDKFSAFEGEVANRDLISSYLPIYAPNTKNIVGVFEVYSDVTPFLAQIRNTAKTFEKEAAINQKKLALQNREHMENVDQGGLMQVVVVALMLVLLYAVLLSIVRRAQKVIDQQTRNAEIAKNRLVQSEKVSALGQMVAGVAHQLNTPLAFSQSNIEMVKQVLDRLKSKAPKEVGQAREMLQDVTLGLGKMAELVHNLRSFTRLDSKQRTAVDINQAVASVVYIARAVISTKTTIDESYGELPLFECSISQLNHVFLNLIMNAAQAIDGHGRVKVSTAVFEGCVCVAVKDNGAGIAPEILPHIFDAYFTTKPAGGVAGTGLGLSIAKDIVEQHGGKITVKSIVGKGSTFVVYLPIHSQKSDSR